MSVPGKGLLIMTTENITGSAMSFEIGVAKKRPFPPK
jgi:hypothetical protein